MGFTTITPILRILDEAKAKEFYVDFLGFKVDWEHRAEGPLYMQISLGECRIHLSEHDGDARQGAAIKLHTDDIEVYVAEIVAKEYPPGVAEEDLGVCEQPWGSPDMLLVDPFGNRLIFYDCSNQVVEDARTSVSVVGNHLFVCGKYQPVLARSAVSPHQLLP